MYLQCLALMDPIRTAYFQNERMNSGFVLFFKIVYGGGPDMAGPQQGLGDPNGACLSDLSSPVFCLS